MTKIALMYITLFLLIAMAVPYSVVQAENWPTWRGPLQNGVADESGLPTDWSQTENVVWRLPLPGAAPSTPVVWDGKIFLTSTDRDSEQVLLLAIDVAGEVVWQREIGSGESEQAEKNNLASPSPSTDGEYVWTFTGDGLLTCFDFEGNRQWQFNVEDRYEKVEMRWGMASSPTPDGKLLYVQLLHLNSSRVIALDKKTGAEVWNIVRETEAEGKCMRSYATPVVYRDAGQEYLLTQGQDYIVAHDLNDGRELWRHGDFHPRTGYDPMMHMSSSPVVAEGIILVPSGNNGNFQALRPNGDGLVTEAEEDRLWQDFISPMRPSALLVDSLAYVCQESGVLYCLDAHTGEQHYKKPLHRHTHHASPVYGDGKIYFASRDGTVTVVRAGSEFEILATNEMNEPLCASPVIVDGRIYLRTFEALYAIEE
jgi:outer membrane protein assembly factor BamB